MMKNYHIATRLFTVLMLSTVLPLCSCEQQETPLSDGEDMLSINATLDGELDVNTRSYSGDVSLVDKGFTIAGYLLKGQYAPETMTIAPNVFDKSTGYQAVSKLSATNAKFKIPLPLIGLGTEDEPTYLSVLAWTQGDTDTGYGITGQTGNSSVGMPYLNINLQSPDKRQGDIAAAQKIDHLNDYVITAIDLDFKHILSKMSFVVKNSTGTGISVKDVKLAVAENALYSKAKYTFNGSDSIGIYSDYNTYYPKKEYTPTGWATTPTLTDAGTATLGELLLIPQKALAGFITVKVTYTVNGDAMNTPITRTLPLKANDLRSGKNYIYTLDVNADAINVINVSVGGWKEAPTNALPMVPGECKADVLLLLDGYDEPYQHTNGKWYWLDRSGYNRHVVLGDGYVSYDDANHGYVFSGTATGGIIPGLGSISNLTIDLVTEHTAGGSHANNSEVFQFSSYSLQLPYSGTNLKWAQPGGNSQWESPSVNELDKLNHWTFITNYSSDKSRIYKNGWLMKEQSFSISSGNVNSGILARSYAGRISYLKVTTSIRSNTDIENEYTSCASRFKIERKRVVYPPTPSQYVYINGLYWTTGNLVAVGNSYCKVGSETDYGLYFQFGSLIGWTGGADGGGQGQGNPTKSNKVWPLEMGMENPNVPWSNYRGNNISTLSNHYFNYSMTPWDTPDNYSDIGTFSSSMPGDTGTGNLRTGRYAKLGIGDPCTYYLGETWRLPKQYEIYNLKGYGFSGWTTYNGISGRWFSNSLFLCGSGFRYPDSNGYLDNAGNQGRYGTASISSSVAHFYMYIDRDQVISPDNNSRDTGIPIRCVR